MRAGDRLIVETVRRGGPWPTVLAVSAVAGAAAELALPLAAGLAIDAVVSANGDHPRLLVLCAALVACVIVCESLAVWARGASGAYASARLRRTLVRHVLGAGPTATGRFAPGELATRAGMNAEEAGGAPDALISAVALLVPTAGGLVALTLIDPALTLALAAGLVVVLFVARAFLRTGTALAGGYQEVQGGIAARLVDALDGARTIASAGTAEREAKRVLAHLPRLRAHGMDLWRATANAGARAGVMVPIVEVAVLAVGGFRLAAGDLTVGELYAAARYAVLGTALSTVLGYVGGLARARAAACRAAEVLALRTMRHGTRTLPPGPGAISFRGVAADGLDIGDLDIPGGSATAVVGSSGTGKSLFAALAGRLLDPARGRVLLDGVPLDELSRDELRRAVGFAFERPVLTGATIGEAIGPGDVADAARAARADAFVRRLPEGYATPLSAAPLSGGERQRLGLARAFAQAERVLVLDDATSSLDTVTEHQVSDALLATTRTRLITAYRPATAARADRVVWLADGRVRGYGTHRELWKDPDYRRVFEEAAP